MLIIIIDARSVSKTWGVNDSIDIIIADISHIVYANFLSHWRDLIIHNLGYNFIPEIVIDLNELQVIN